MKEPSLLSKIAFWLLCQVLPADRRERQYRDFLAELQYGAAAWQLFFQVIRGVLKMSRPFDVPAGAFDVPRRRSDQRRLRMLRSSIVLLCVAYMMMVALMMLLPGGLTVALWAWTINMAFGLSVCIGAVWFGFGFDLPWLRGSRLGSALLLGFLLGPVVWMGFGGGLPAAGYMLWVGSLALFILWDAYWTVRRPIRRTGLFSPRSR